MWAVCGWTRRGVPLLKDGALFRPETALSYAPLRKSLWFHGVAIGRDVRFSLWRTVARSRVMPCAGGVKNEMNSLLVLRNLRNQIAHTRGNQISWEDAMRFQIAADRIIKNASDLLSKKLSSLEEINRRNGTAKHNAPSASSIPLPIIHLTKKKAAKGRGGQ